MRQRHKRAASRLGAEAAEICKALRDLQACSGHNLHVLWRDWIAATAYALANGCDRREPVWSDREAEYMRIVARHGRDVMLAYQSMFHDLLVPAFEDMGDEPVDYLGSLYMSLELGNDATGQFFTPSSASRAMAEMMLGSPESIEAELAARDFITVCDPAVGGGSTLIATIGVLRRSGLGPRSVHFTGVDVDLGVLQMAYIQLSLLGVPASLIHGNSLSLECFSPTWYTPVHVFDGWTQRLRGQRPVTDLLEQLADLAAAVDLAEVEPEPEPEPEPEVEPEVEPEPEPAAEPEVEQLGLEW